MAGVPYISYTATKAAVIQFTRVIALQYARKGIRTNSILPGMMNTPMVHAPEVIAAYDCGANGPSAWRVVSNGLMGDAWDVAFAALFLASDEAKYLGTDGTELVVDGGLTVNCVCDVWPPNTDQLWHTQGMPDERLTLRQADQAREDFASIAEDLDFIKFQLARLPTRKEQAFKPLHVMFGSAGLVILWIELFR